MQSANRGTGYRSLLAAVGILTMFSVLPARASTKLILTFSHGNAWAVNQPVTLYFSQSMVSGKTNDKGMATFNIESGNAFWIVVNGQRLAKFYQLNTVPVLIDIDKVGVIHWRGGSNQ